MGSGAMGPWPTKGIGASEQAEPPRTMDWAGAECCEKVRCRLLGGSPERVLSCTRFRVSGIQQVAAGPELSYRHFVGRGARSGRGPSRRAAVQPLEALSQEPRLLFFGGELTLELNSVLLG